MKAMSSSHSFVTLRHPLRLWVTSLLIFSLLNPGSAHRRAVGSDTEDAEGINLTHLSPPVRSWVYIGGLGKVMSKESAPPMLTCLSIHQQLWINRWIMGIVLWRLIHLIILHMLFLSFTFYLSFLFYPSFLFLSNVGSI